MPRLTRNRHIEPAATTPRVARLGSRSGRKWAWLLVCAVLVMLAVPGSAFGGTYVVRSCGEQGDNLGTAFNLERLTVRMFARRGCNIVGRGRRGLLTGNFFRKGGRVRRGSEGRFVMRAPQGATFVGLKWAGEVRRPDCRYEAQVYAQGPRGFAAVPHNFPSHQRCAETKRVRFASRKGVRDYPFRKDSAGRPIEATRIVQRIECEARREKPFCSNRRANYVLTYRAFVTVKDETAPQGQILSDTPLARGEWVRGDQPLNYEASDNVGIRGVALPAADVSEDRTCDHRQVVPCPNGRGQVQVNTSILGEGTQPLSVTFTDSASNSAGVTSAQPARIDRTAPGATAVGVDGGEAWRNSNSFTARWANPAENDRAPIVGARYELCPVGGGQCLRDQRSGEGIAELAGLAVPTMGEWHLRLWREDQAGNHQPENASLPVTLRYDGERPELGFEPIDAQDPTRLAAAVTDKVSGLAGGQIEISREGSGNWQQLTTAIEGNRLVARLDDGRLEAGTYVVRGFARDQAGNQGSTDRRLDGNPMVIRIPLRATTSLNAGVEVRTVRRVRRGGKRVRRRTLRVRRLARVGFGRTAAVVGTLTSDGGRVLPDSEIQVFSRSETQPEQLAGTARTGPRGRFRYRLGRGSSRLLRFVYAGTALSLPSQAEVSVRVPAATTISISRRRLLNGGTVRFGGRLRAAAANKLVEMQVLLSRKWQTFRTTRTEAGGRWRVAYRFRRTCGVARYRFRARLPKEQGYPYEAGRTRAVRVSVRGRSCR